MDDMPNEKVEMILSYLDGYTLTNARLVCRKWHRIIDAAPWEILPKVHFHISIKIRAAPSLSPSLLFYTKMDNKINLYGCP
jgi:hypothetical protein